MNEIILKVLESQKFADWYNSGHFNEHISGSHNGEFTCDAFGRVTNVEKITKQDILLEIEQMFKTKGLGYIPTAGC